MGPDLNQTASEAARWPDRRDGDHPLIIGLSGGSGSGKTTIAESVVDIVGSEHVVLIPHDAYYRDQSSLSVEERAMINYDHPDSLETELLADHLKRLRAGESVQRPVYDFSTHTRSGETVEVDAESVILVEGILVLAEPALRELMDLKVYVDTDADLRLLRRLKRDVVERDRTVESVIEQYEATVRPMHIQFVEPSKRFADIIVPEGYNPGAVGTVISMIRHYVGSEGATR
jgi:uridine kinase